MGPSGLSCRRRRLRILILRQLRQFVLFSCFFHALRQWRPLRFTINTQLVNLQRIEQHSNLLASLQSLYMSPITSLSILLSPTLGERKRPNAATARHATSHAETNLTPQTLSETSQPTSSTSFHKLPQVQLETPKASAFNPHRGRSHPRRSDMSKPPYPVLLRVRILAKEDCKHDAQTSTA